LDARLSTQYGETILKFDLAGKIALVTGANRGIGKAITEALLNNGAAKVYAAVRDVASAKPLQDAHGDKIVPVEFDLARPDLIVAAAKAAGDVHLVVNNAGVLRTATPLAAEAIESMQYEVERNVYGLMRVAQAFAPVLKANGGGAFAQLNSVASLKSFPDFATYCASKAASYSITQALRKFLGEQGTAVFSVHPSPPTWPTPPDSPTSPNRRSLSPTPSWPRSRPDSSTSSPTRRQNRSAIPTPPSPPTLSKTTRLKAETPHGHNSDETSFPRSLPPRRRGAGIWIHDRCAVHGNLSKWHSRPRLCRGNGCPIHRAQRSEARWVGSR
jgi:NAD(P)-dependent dehydrogenase (short-subunit alcohol dehydrogenase family)